MVSFEEVPESKASEQIGIPASQERLLDAQEIEEAAMKMHRPTARMQLEGLAKKLRKEGEALKRVEASRRRASEEDTTTTAPPPLNTPSPALVEPPPEKPEPSSTPDVPVPPPSVPSTSAAAAAYSGNGAFVSIDRFSFDAGGYNAPFVSVYVNLNGVGSIARDLIMCNFTSSSFDLIVKDLNGKSYRLVKDHLEKDIDPDKSKIIVKADKIVVKLAKVKQGDYGGYDYWSKLTDTKAKPGKTKSKGGADPQSSIMDLMKSMYDEGDDKIRKVIGETMMKQQQGGLGKDDFNKDLGDGYDDM